LGLVPLKGGNLNPKFQVVDTPVKQLSAAKGDIQRIRHL